MIKVKLRDTAILGLTEMNIQRLIKGDAMKLNLRDIGFPSQNIIILYGKTEQDIAFQFKDAFSMKTKVIDESTPMDALVKRIASDMEFTNDPIHNLPAGIVEQLNSLFTKASTILLALKESKGGTNSN